MTLLSASITNISPSRLFILRWACKLIGANMKAWKTRSRKEKVVFFDGAPEKVAV